MQRSASSYHTDVKIFIAHFSSRFNLQAYFLRPSLYLSFFLYRQGEITKLNRLAAFYNRRIHTTPTSIFLSLFSLPSFFVFLLFVGRHFVKVIKQISFPCFSRNSLSASLDQPRLGPKIFVWKNRIFFIHENVSLPSNLRLADSLYSTQNPTAETRARPFQLS